MHHAKHPQTMNNTNAISLKQARMLGRKCDKKSNVVMAITPMILGIGALLIGPGCWDWSVTEEEDGGNADQDGDSCVCHEGPCCDGCHFLGTDVRCSDEPLLSEYRCSSPGCGADPQRRGAFRHCGGASSECPEDVVREGEWEMLQECTDDQLCVVREGLPTCHSCAEGCADGHCNERECSDGDCCDGRNYLPSTTQCSATPDDTQCNCSSGECGADVQCRRQYRFCTGGTADCTTENLQWTDFEEETDCSNDQSCVDEGDTARCETCESSCELGVCIESECSSGPCCDGTSFRDTSYLCSTVTEYRCDGTACGADAQEREVTQRCSGTSSVCDGVIDEGSWSTVDACTSDQECNATSEGASCVDCPAGCSLGACVLTGCDLVDDFESAATLPNATWASWFGDDIAETSTVAALQGSRGFDLDVGSIQCFSNTSTAVNVGQQLWLLFRLNHTLSDSEAYFIQVYVATADDWHYGISAQINLWVDELREAQMVAMAYSEEWESATIMPEATDDVDLIDGEIYRLALGRPSTDEVTGQITTTGGDVLYDGSITIEDAGPVSELCIGGRVHIDQVMLGDIDTNCFD